jgi:hypothetical protein
MGIYTLADLVEDCSSKKSRLELPAKEKRRIYAEAWEALNRWIDAQFEKGEGVNITNFARVTWETVARTLTGEERRRPHFSLHESFCRANGLPARKGQGSHAISLAKCTELNFSIISIKYSKTLTKDQAFTATRDLLQRLGQVFSSGRPCAIELHVGKLVAKERKVALLFDVARFRDYLESGEEWKPAPGQAAGAGAGAGAGAAAAPPPQEAADLSARGLEALEQALLGDESAAAPAPPGRVPALDLQGVSAEEEAPRQEEAEGGAVPLPEEEPVDALAAFTSSLAVRSGGGGGGGSSSGGPLVSSRSAYSGITDLGGSGGPDGAANKREMVLEEAYRRHLTTTQGLVDDEDREEREIDEQRFQREMLARMRKAERATERRENQAHVLRQMSDRRKKAVADKMDEMETTACSLPMASSAFQVDGDMLTDAEREWDAQTKTTKKELLGSLQYQIEDKKRQAERKKAFEREEERRFLRHVSNEVQQSQSEKQVRAAAVAAAAVAIACLPLFAPFAIAHLAAPFPSLALNNCQIEAAMKRKDLVDAWTRDNYVNQLLRMRREQLAIRRPDPFKTAANSVGYDMRSAR